MAEIRSITWQWILVAVLVLAVFALGFAGFREYGAATGRARSHWDLAYLSLQLFILHSGDVEGPINPPLQVARFLAPLVSAYTVVYAMLALFTIQTRRIWIWLRGDHVIVCGLGPRGANLVQQLRSQGERVAVIDTGEDDAGANRYRELGALVLIGTANDAWTLRKAYVHRAKILIAVTGDDGSNVEAAVLARDLVQNRSQRPLRCIVHVADPGLETVFRQLYSSNEDRFELEFFNIYQMGARVMLREPPVLVADRPGPVPHLLIVGLGQLGEALLWRAARDWRIDHPDATAKLRVTVVDRQATTKQQWLCLRYPELSEFCEVELVALDVRSPEFARGTFLLPGDGAKGVTVAYVCLDDDPLGLYAALQLRRYLGPAQTPIVVRTLLAQAGLAKVLGAHLFGAGVIDGVRAVGLLDITCTPEFVLGGMREVLARAIHQDYVRDQSLKGASSEKNFSMASWFELRDDLKESNRQAARDIPRKLQAVGCEAVPQCERAITLMEFTPEEIELLSKMEHDRWVDDRRAGGWRYGLDKDVEKRVSPYLVAWDELPEDVKEYDRQAIRRLPAVLAKADYDIRRLGKSISSSNNKQLLDEINAAKLWFPAWKTRPIWAKRLDQDREVKTLEGEQRAAAGDYLCRGPAGEIWPQEAKRLEAKYVASDIVDEDGWRRYDPRPDANAVLAAQVNHPFSVHTRSGCLSGQPGDYLVKNAVDRDVLYPEDIWVVSQVLFEATYEVANGRSGE